MSLGDPGPELGPEDGADAFPFLELGVAAFSFASFCVCRQYHLNISAADDCQMCIPESER